LRVYNINNLYGWLLALPAFVLLGVFTYYPTVATFINSLYSNETIIRPKHFVGLDNYRFLINDPIFLTTLKNTAIFAFGTVPISIALSLIMALLVHSKIPARGLVRLSYFTPTILPMVAAANIWLFFYSPQIGLINKVIEYFGFNGINWLGNSHTVLASLMVMTIWKEAGFFMIFYLAALQSLPKELLEAAKIEGATKWQSFWKVTFPLITPTTFFIMINALLNAFKLVDHLFILTKGGPDNASNLLLYYIYEVAFSFFDFAYASTLTVVLISMLVVLSLLYFTIIEKKVHYK